MLVTDTVVTPAMNDLLVSRIHRGLVSLTLGMSLLLVSTGVLDAQLIYGRLVDAETSAGIDQAFVVLLNDDAIEVNRVVTGVNGAFRVAAPSPGAYQLRSERIGFRSTVSDLIEVGADESREVVIHIRPIVIRLDTIRVEDAAKECRVRGEQGLATAAVWEEARKHLAAVAWSEPRLRFRYEMRSYERYVDRAGTVLDEADTLHTATHAPAYHSLPINQLQEYGYAFIGDSSFSFYAPDAKEFFSDVFLRWHCFNLTKDDEHEGLIGLEFKPVGGNEVSDIRGVFWLDDATSEIQWLELGYTNVRPRIYEREARGRVEFEQVPNGPWFVRRWWIRVPDVSLGLLSILRVVRGYHENGGEVRRIFDLDNESVFGVASQAVEPRVPKSTLTIRGAVFDSSSLQPVSDVAVYLDGANLVDSTDSEGSFRLSDMADGTHLLAFLKDGNTPRLFSFDVTETYEDEIDLGLVLVTRGPAPIAHISGTVVDWGTGEPVPGVTVSVNGIITSTRTDDNGVFEVGTAEVRPGSNLLGIRRIGYAPVVVPLWVVKERTQFNVRVPVEKVAVELEEFVVEAERTADSSRRLREFERRRRAGLGEYFTRQDIKQRQPYYVTDLITLVPGVSMVYSASGSQAVRMMRHGGCAPMIYLDGARISAVTLQPDGFLSISLDIDHLVGPDDVAGIEVYRGAAQVPPEFSTLGSDCGVIAIWTR